MFFAIPFWKHACPNRAACWSPATPQMGIGVPSMFGCVFPNCALESFTCGRMLLGMFSVSSSFWSQVSVLMLYRSVLDALEWSVACVCPCVSFHISHVSIVPNSSFPFSACCLAFGTLSSIHLIFVAEKYASIRSPVCCLMYCVSPLFFRSLHMSAVRRSCQTIALYIGFPVSFSQMTVVSRWFVIAIAAMFLGCMWFFLISCCRVFSCVFHISFGSCSTHALFGYICVNSCCVMSMICAFSSNSMLRQLVVP